jgi:pimeloyl-ACP methyl ester carboxylesterase
MMPSMVSADGLVPVRILSLTLALLTSLGCRARREAELGEIPRGDGDMNAMTMRMHAIGGGEPLVLVGGGLTGWLSWIPHQERLASSRRVARAQPLIVQLGLDARPVPADYSVESESAALAAAVDALHPDGPLDFVAWSFGGFVTLDYALDHPERVRSLTLIEPSAFWVLEANGDATYELERDALRPLAERLRDDVTEDDLVEFVRFASLCPPDVDPRELPQWPVWVEHRRSLRRQFDAELGHHDTLDRLRGFERPVLLVKGRGSTPALHRVVDTLAEALPRARVLELDGGHAPQIVEVDRFLDELESFHAAPHED